MVQGTTGETLVVLGDLIWPTTAPEIVLGEFSGTEQEKDFDTLTLNKCRQTNLQSQSHFI